MNKKDVSNKIVGKDEVERLISDYAEGCEYDG